jgi:hypothetical protein
MAEPAARLTVASPSRATDAGYLAAADIATVAARLGADYRLIGGNAVTLLVEVHGVAGLVPARETADADLGASYQVVADPRLVDALGDLGYARVEGNRFVRALADRHGELELAIDVLAPSYEARLINNRRHGDLVVDEVPGLPLALARPGTEVHVDVRLTSGEGLVTRLVLPDVVSALCLKAYAYAGRLQPRDALDIWRLLEAASAAGVRAAAWPAGGMGSDAGRILHTHFGRAAGRGPAAATRSVPQQTRIRALIRQVVAAPTRP